MNTSRSYNAVNKAPRTGRKITRKKAYVRLNTSVFRNPKKARGQFKKASRAKHVIPQMSKCAIEYLKVQYDPWNLKTSPCIPDTIQLPSYKFSTHLRSTFSTNANGFGWIVMNPYVPSSSATNAGGPANTNYLAPIWASTSTGASVQIPIDRFADRTQLASGITAAGAAPFYWPSGITAAQVENNLNGNDFTYNWRPVGGGIKVRYTGRADAQSGNYTIFSDPGNNSTLYSWAINSPPGSAANSGTMLGLEEAAFTSIGLEEIAVTHHPKAKFDLEYSDNWYNSAGAAFYSNGQDTALYHTMAILIEGAPANTSFAFDAIMHWEMVGRGLPARTASEADTIGLEKVTNTFPIKPPTTTPAKTFSAVTNRLAKVLLKEGVNAMYQFGGGPATVALGNVLGDMIDAYTDFAPGENI